MRFADRKKRLYSEIAEMRRKAQKEIDAGKMYRNCEDSRQKLYIEFAAYKAANKFPLWFIDFIKFIDRVSGFFGLTRGINK
jgi:phage tail tube protein FII